MASQQTDSVKKAWSIIFSKERQDQVHKEKSLEGNLAEYDGISECYDSNYKLFKYNAPEKIVQTLFQHYKADTTSLKVLDVCCGTGLLGEAMSQSNFKGILDGVDGSEKMLNVAKGKRFYTNLFFKIITREDPMEIKESSYDAIIASGAFGQSHVDPRVLYDFVGYLKPEGFIIFAMRITTVEIAFKCMENVIEELCKAKLVRCLSREKFEYYHLAFDRSGKCQPHYGVQFCLQKI